MSQHDAPDDDNPNEVDELTDIHFVGPATAAVLADADFDGTGIADKSVSYEMLVEAGVNHGVAARLRKKHSLHWSFGGSDEDDGSLERRSEKVRGLQDGEREWVAASSGDWESTDAGATVEDGGTGDDGATADGATVDAATGGDWTPTGAGAADGNDAAQATTDGSGAAEAAEAAWRDRSRPDPVTDVPGVTDEIADILANGGVTSIRSLATANPEHVADSLGLAVERVTEWRDAARDLA